MLRLARGLLGLGMLVWSLALAVPALAQCPEKTRITDTLLNADGTPAAGRVVIAWPTFQVGTCQVIAGQASINLSDGLLDLELYPNDAASPAGTSYRATYYLRSGRITTEYWVVPTSALPVTLAIVRSPTAPAPAVMFSMAQVTDLLPSLANKLELPSPCPAGRFLQVAASGFPPQLACAEGTGAPLASQDISGTVKTDTSEADPRVYTLAGVDSLLAQKAALTHQHTAEEIAAGILDPARLPAPTVSTLGGVHSGACSGTDKVTGISPSGDLQCGPDQAGGGGSQHQVDGAHLAANDPVNFQSSATIAFSNPSGGNLQATISDSSLTAQMLNVANPTAAQLSGLGDDNIPAGALSPNRISGTALVEADRAVSPAADRIPQADGSGKLADGWLSDNVTRLGDVIDLATETSGLLPVEQGGTGADLSATGGAGQFLKQAAPGGSFTVSAITTAELPAVTVDSPSKLANSLCTDGQVLKKSSSEWICSADETGEAGGGITSLNSLTAASQSLAAGSGGSDFAISSSGSTHTINLPTASATNRGALSPSDWSVFNNKASTGACTNQFLRSISASSVECAAVAADDLTSDAVTAEKLASGAVTTAKIADANVTPAKLSNAARDRVITWTLLDPTTSETGLLRVRLPAAATIISVACDTDAGTVDINPQKRGRTTPNTAGTNALSASLACDNNAEETSTINSAGISASELLALMITATSGSPTVVNVYVTVRMD
jgi:hypothetical protein